jgi:hypothetical protein
MCAMKAEKKQRIMCLQLVDWLCQEGELDFEQALEEYRKGFAYQWREMRQCGWPVHPKDRAELKALYNDHAKDALYKAFDRAQ